jgi:hypothetical protein
MAIGYLLMKGAHFPDTARVSTSFERKIRLKLILAFWFISDDPYRRTAVQRELASFNRMVIFRKRVRPNSPGSYFYASFRLGHKTSQAAHFTLRFVIFPASLITFSHLGNGARPAAEG